MTRQEFIEQLTRCGIDPNIVFFEPRVADGFGIRKNYFRWEAFFQERGKEYSCIGFPSESDALQYVLDALIKLYAGRQP